MPAKCLYCYTQTGPYEGDFHIACAKKVFAAYPPPLLPFESSQIAAVANQQGRVEALFTKERKQRGSLQPRLLPNATGSYTIKAEVARPYYIPELEHLCLKLATEAGINTIENTLLNAADGEKVLVLLAPSPLEKGLGVRLLSEITNNINPEQGTYEKLLKAIEKHSSQPGLDKLYMAERLVFSFLIGNSNVHLGNTHLKSLSPLGERDLGREVKMGKENNSPPAKGEYPSVAQGEGVKLAPLSQSTSTALLQPALADDFVLSLAGKRTGLDEEIFMRFFEKVGINNVAAKNMMRRYSRTLRAWFTLIENSFLPDDTKRRFVRLIVLRAERLGMM